MDLTDLGDVTALDELVYGVGHSSHQKIDLELPEHIVVQGIVQRLSVVEIFPHPVNSVLTASHR